MVLVVVLVKAAVVVVVVLLWLRTRPSIHPLVLGCWSRDIELPLLEREEGKKWLANGCWLG